MKGSFTLNQMDILHGKKSNHRFDFLTKNLLTAVLILFCISAWSQNNYTGANNGNWSVAGNWSLGHVPLATETVTVPNARNINIDTGAVCASLAFAGGNSSNTFTLTGSNTLTVTGAVTLGAPTGGAFLIPGTRTKTLAIGAGTLTCGSLAMSDTADAFNLIKVTVSTGKITCAGNISMAGALSENNLAISSTGILEIGGPMPPTEGTFTLSTTSTVRYNGAGNQNIYNKGFATIVIPIAVDLSYGNLEFSGGGNKTALGTFYVAGNWVNNAAFVPAGSTVGFIGSGVQTIGGSSATTFNNLSILRNDPTTLASDVSVTGTLQLGGIDPSLSSVDGQLDIANRTLTLVNAVTAGDLSFDNEDMIIASGAGKVRRSFAATGSYTFPIGDNTGPAVEYSPITVNVTAGTFSGAFVAVSVTDAKHPNNASASNHTTRYWNVTQTGITGAVATVTSTAVPADVVGSVAGISTGQLSGTFNQSTNPWIKFAGMSGNNLVATGALLADGVTSAFTGLAKAAPTVAISGGGTFCQNATVTLTASPVGDATFLYNWSGGLGTANTASPATNTPGTANYVVTATDGNGFIATNNTNVTINANPTFGSAAQAATVCENSTATINLTGMLPNATSSVSYTINGGPVQTATGVLSDPSGNASFTLPVTLVNNGQQLVVTSVVRTDVTPNCPITPAANTTSLSVNQNFTYYADDDVDGFGDAADSQVSCFGAPTGYVLDNTDCNDHQIYYQDLDNDGFGSIIMVACGTATVNTDCNDNEASAHPGASEIGYDLIDNDCDGLTDEGFPPKETTLMTSFCNVTLAQIDTPIFANLVAGAQGYRWRITTMIGGVTPGQVQYLDTPLRSMKLIQLGTYAFNTTYRVELAVYYAGHLQPYLSSNCTVKTPATTTQLTECGTTIVNMVDVIYANIVPFATGYRFKVYDPANPLVFQELDRNLREFRMNLITAFVLQYGKVYNVECAIRNTDGTYLPYGQVCTVTTPLFPTTWITDDQCDNGVGGPYQVPNNFTIIYAESFPGAISYAFKLVGPGLPPAGSVRVKPLRAFSLSDFAGAGILPGQTYNVSVRMIFNFSNPDGPYGKVCTLNAPGLLRDNPTAGSTWNAVAWPNPFVDSFSLFLDSSSSDKVGIAVYDLTGRLLERYSVAADQIKSLRIAAGFPSGVYSLIVSQGDQTRSLRVVKR